MPDLVDMRVAELLCARLCHELVSPVGAVNNGVELIEEFDDSMLPDALSLIGTSARLASARLQFFRMAYGVAGTQSIESFSEMKQLAEAFLAEGRSTLRWPEGAVLPEFEDGWSKLLLNLIYLAAETLPRGGTLGVTLDDDVDGLCMTVAAIGEGPRITEECRQAMAPDAAVEVLTPRNVHAYFAARLARRLASCIAVDDATPDRLAFAVRLTR